jgi:DNA repair protein RecO (recombination protein O)
MARTRRSNVSTERLYRTEGIVIRRREQGEADRVLTLYTPLGKIEVIAKGARKLRSRKAGHIELFSRSSFVVSRVRNSWDIVSQAETIEPHTLLRDDLLRGTYARYAVELLDRFFTQGEGSRALFDLLDHTLTWLCRDSDLDLIARFYEQHLLGLAGFRPELFRCVGEHNRHVSLRPRDPTEDKPSFGFDPERGGALCPTCYDRRKARPEVVALSAEGLWFLQECQRRPYARLHTQHIAPALHAEAERVMQHYITYHLERGVNSGAFLRRLKRENR